MPTCRRGSEDAVCRTLVATEEFWLATDPLPFGVREGVPSQFRRFQSLTIRKAVEENSDVNSWLRVLSAACCSRPNCLPSVLGTIFDLSTPEVLKHVRSLPNRTASGIFF